MGYGLRPARPALLREFEMNIQPEVSRDTTKKEIIKEYSVAGEKVSQLVKLVIEKRFPVLTGKIIVEFQVMGNEHFWIKSNNKDEYTIAWGLMPTHKFFGQALEDCLGSIKRQYNARVQYVRSESANKLRGLLLECVINSAILTKEVVDSLIPAKIE